MVVVRGAVAFSLLRVGLLKRYTARRMITKCPEYVSDKASNSENKKKTRVTNKELDTMKRLRDDGLSYFEIAKIVDRNPDVVRVNLVRC